MYLEIISVQIIMSKLFIPLTRLQSFYSFNKQTAIQIFRFLQRFYGIVRMRYAHSNWAITLGNAGKLLPGLGMGNCNCISRQYVLYNNRSVLGNN